MYASLFEYEVHSNAMKALISYWNCPTNTILTRTGEMRISLLDVAEIGGCQFEERYLTSTSSFGSRRGEQTTELVEAIWVSDCSCREKSYVYPPMKLGYVTIEELEYVMAIRPTLRSHHHGLNN